MCLIGLAIDAHPRWALVIAANRDEFHERPTAPLDWWPATEGRPRTLAGRDQSAGGTWMGFSAQGRIGLLTNVRDPRRHRSDAPSRGALVAEWLDSVEEADRLWPAWSRRGCNPFNFVGGDLATGRWWWADDRSLSLRPLRPGLHALSNGALHEPWPKVEAIRSAMAAELPTNDDPQTLAASLLHRLADRRAAADEALPDTGIGLDRERALSPVFIHLPEMRYGTRSSTVLIGQRMVAGWRIHIVERTFDAAGRAVEDRSVTLERWPIEATAQVRCQALS